MTTLDEHLFQPETTIFQGVMTIDTFGLFYLLDAFSDAYYKTVLDDKKLLDLEESWVKRLADSLFFKHDGVLSKFEIGENTKEGVFVYYDEELKLTLPLSNWFISTHGEDAALTPKPFSIALILQFLMAFDFEKLDRDSSVKNIDFKKVKEFEIRDYQNEKVIKIPMSDFVEITK